MPAPQPSLGERIGEIRRYPQYAARTNLPFELTFVEGGSEGNRLIQKRDVNSKAPPAAVLRVIAEISRSNARLRPGGTYNPTNRFPNEDVTKAKLRFTINAPKDLGHASTEYDTFVKNLKLIHKSDIRAGKPPELYPPMTEKNEVTVFHRLIIPRDDDVPCDNATMVSEGNDTGDRRDPFSFEGWPVATNSPWRRELDQFKDTHDIYPMQAFGIDGELISPSDYEKELRGATVDLSFTLVHYNFSTSSRLCLYMTELHVLVPPSVLPGTPVSRNGVRRHDYNAHQDGSPTKMKRYI